MVFFSLANILISILVATAIAPFIINFLYKKNILRYSEYDFSTIIERRNMKVGTPVMGGLIFVIPIIILSLAANFDFRNFTLSGTVKIPILVFAISAILGGLDDVWNIFGRERSVKSFSRTIKVMKVHKNIFYRLYLFLLLPWTAYKSFFYMLGSNPGKGIQAHEKILVQLIIGIIVTWWIFVKLMWTHIWIPVIGNVDIGILIIPFIIMSVITLTNAVNISDGLDGLSSGLALISFVSFLFVSLFLVENPPISVICAITIGSLIPYLYFNIPPARVQMGDVGSLALGTLLAAIAFSLNRPFLLLFFCGIFIIELFSSLIQGIGRRVLGRRIFKMAPLHHHFEMLGWSQEKIVMRFWLFQIILSIIGLFICYL